MRWDSARLMRAGALLAWAGFYGYLWVGGGMVRYLGPRTYWVTIFGGLTLGTIGIAYLATARSSGPVPGRRELSGLALILAPVILAAALPATQLGALAASRKGVGATGTPLTLVPEPAGEVSFREIHFASSSPRYAASAGVGPGTPVELTGFVTDASSTSPWDLELTRFYVSCCAADAIPYSVPVDDPRPARSSPPEDTWLRAGGILELRGDRLVLVARNIVIVQAPTDPYLY
jgi:putative membrane protein